MNRCALSKGKHNNPSFINLLRLCTDIPTPVPTVYLNNKNWQAAAMHAFSAAYVCAWFVRFGDNFALVSIHFFPSSHRMKVGICSARFVQVNLLLTERKKNHLYKNGTNVPEYDAPLRRNLVSTYESGIFRRLHFPFMWNGMDDTIRLRPVCACLHNSCVAQRAKSYVSAAHLGWIASVAFVLSYCLLICFNVNSRVHSSGKSAALKGTSAFLLMMYFTEWKVTNMWIPFYGSSKRFTDPPLW